MKTTAVLLLVAGAVALVQGHPEVAPISLPSQAGSRVTKGSPAVNGQFPFHAFLVNSAVDGSHITCAGSLISTEWVLTSARCLTNALRVNVYLGHVNFGESPVMKVASNTIRHSRYNPKSVFYDIGLVKLTTPVTLKGGTPNTELTYTDVKVINTRECAKLHGIESFGTAVMCAVEVNSETQGTCNGESGSPLVVKLEDGRWNQIGVASFGPGGCSTDLPSTFVTTGHNAEWIYWNTNIR